MDSTAVSKSEKEEAMVRGKYLRVVKPTNFKDVSISTAETSFEFIKQDDITISSKLPKFLKNIHCQLDMISAETNQDFVPLPPVKTNFNPHRGTFAIIVFIFLNCTII